MLITICDWDFIDMCLCVSLFCGEGGWVWENPNEEIKYFTGTSPIHSFSILYDSKMVKIYTGVTLD
jgi:hypothetical protein